MRPCCPVAATLTIQWQAELTSQARPSFMSSRGAVTDFLGLLGLLRNDAEDELVIQALVLEIPLFLRHPLLESAVRLNAKLCHGSRSFRSCVLDEASMTLR